VNLAGANESWCEVTNLGLLTRPARATSVLSGVTSGRARWTTLLSTLRCDGDSEVPDEGRIAMSDALELYLYEESYSTRLRRLASVVLDAASACVGGKPVGFAGGAFRLLSGRSL
jgi:hypothetical protein